MRMYYSLRWRLAKASPGFGRSRHEFGFIAIIFHTNYPGADFSSATRSCYDVHTEFIPLPLPWGPVESTKESTV